MSIDRKKLSAFTEWRHVKTGATYLVFGVARCATNGPRDCREESVIYWSRHAKVLYYREVSEFLDGRFVPLED